MRDVSVKNRCPTPIPLVLQEAGTVGLTLPVRKAVFRRSESEGRTPEVMATPLKTDLMGTNHLTCQRDTVSDEFL